MSTVHLSGLHNNTAAGYGNTARGGSCLSIKGGRHNVALGTSEGWPSGNTALGRKTLVNVVGGDDNIAWCDVDEDVGAFLDWETLTECDIATEDDSSRIRFDEASAPGGIYRCSYCGTRQERRDDGLLTCRQCGGELELTR
jgi:hypothetical protein